MSKTLKTSEQLAAIVLPLLRVEIGCKEATGVTILALEDDRVVQNWYVSHVHGDVGRLACEAALARILPELQRRYDLSLKPLKAPDEVIQLILDQLRKKPGCEKVDDVWVFERKQPNDGPNWNAGYSLGEAITNVVRTHLYSIVESLQQQYDVAFEDREAA
jgi:hypothetical protein